MLIYYILFTVVITFFTFLESVSSKFKHGMLLSFILIFIFISIRYDFGNDYAMYHSEFHKLNTIDNLKGYAGLERLESGWIYLNRAFKHLGFFTLIVFWSLIYSIVMYKYIRKTLDKKLFAIAVFFFLASSGSFLIHLSALRQSIALLFFLIAIKYIIEKKIISYLLIIFIASLFHSSVLLLLPLYFLNYMKVNNKLNVIYFLTYLALYSVGNLFSSFINDIVIFIKPGYSYYLEEKNNVKAEINSGYGVFLHAINFFILLLVNNNLKKSNAYIQVAYKLVIISYIISPLSLSVGMVGRVNFYFIFFQIFTIPFVFSSIKNKNLKVIYLLFNILFTIYGLYNFFDSDVFKEKYNDYKTIFNIEAVE